MTRIRSTRSIRSIVTVLGWLCACPALASAQTFLEVGGGWNYLAPAPAGQRYGRGFDVRASVGRQLTPDLIVRLDAFTNQFDETVPILSHLNNPGPIGCTCPPPTYDRRYNGVAGLTASGLVNVDSRGIVYLIGGVGLYDSYGGAPRVSTGVSAGGGITVPIGRRVRMFVEARDHFLLGAGNQPPWLVPVTFGIRAPD